MRALRADAGWATLRVADAGCGMRDRALRADAGWATLRVADAGCGMRDRALRADAGCMKEMYNFAFRCIAICFFGRLLTFEGLA